MPSAIPRSLRHSTTLLALVATALLGCGARRLATSALAPPGPEALAAAGDDYRAACASCHGLDARGLGPEAAKLVPPPPDLTLLAARHGGIFPTDDVVAVITGEREIAAHGPRAMPVWSDRLGSGDAATAAASIYTRRRVEMLARYLSTLQRSR
jgi:mono/diheme cytochrome c family protein